MPKARLVTGAMLAAPEVSVHRAQVPSGPQATGHWVLPTALAGRPSWKVMTLAVHLQGLSTAHPTCGLTDGHSQTALGSPNPRQPAASSILQGPQDSRAARQARHVLWVSCHPLPGGQKHSYPATYSEPRCCPFMVVPEIVTCRLNRDES